MKSNPYIHAIAAVAYITGLVTFLRFLETYRSDTPDTILDGIGAISLFVFSAAVMAFLFFYEPVVKLMENKKGEAIAFFLKTLGAFGLITILILVLVSVG